MSRYFFHIRDGQYFLPDDEGMECRNLRAVEDERNASSTDLANAALRARLTTAPASIEIEDEQGEIVSLQAANLWLN